ncbi:MAG: DUF2062 domain-containing protein [Opitutales bacterium]|nr:DUF2062 domain-containing protein [Opitutales bacterium]
MERFQKEWEEFRIKRFRVTKKWMKYFPSRVTLRKNFFFRKFGSVLLDKIPQLWSFAYQPMRAAYFAGWILTWLPVMGIQIPIAILLAVLFRANVLLLIAIQMVSNPLTVPFMYPLEFSLGKWFASLLPFHSDFITQASLKGMLSAIKSGSWEQLFSIGFGGFLLACLGGTLIGTVCAYVSCRIHKRILRNSLMTYEEFVALKQKELEKLKKWK